MTLTQASPRPRGRVEHPAGVVGTLPSSTRVMMGSVHAHGYQAGLRQRRMILIATENSRAVPEWRQNGSQYEHYLQVLRSLADSATTPDERLWRNHPVEVILWQVAPTRNNRHVRRWVAGIARRLRHVLQDAIRDISLSQKRQARLIGKAKQAIMREPMLKDHDLGNQVEQHRVSSAVIGLRSDRGYVYPQFQFDPDRGCVYDAVRRVNTILNAAADPWGIAAWWFSPHAGLETRPCDLVGGGRATERDNGHASRWAENWEVALIAAAEDVLEASG